jgi:AraC-like DNA-binding protein
MKMQKRFYGGRLIVRGNKIKNYIRANRYKKLKVENVAAHFNLSKKEIQYRLRFDLNDTFSSILQNARIEAVCRLLRKTDKKLKEIAYMCGYYDAPYMNRVFRNMQNITPRRYRKKHRTL